MASAFDGQFDGHHLAKAIVLSCPQELVHAAASEAAQIGRWISTADDVEFELLYRASRDGWAGQVRPRPTWIKQTFKSSPDA